MGTESKKISLDADAHIRQDGFTIHVEATTAPDSGSSSVNSAPQASILAATATPSLAPIQQPASINPPPFCVGTPLAIENVSKRNYDNLWKLLVRASIIFGAASNAALLSYFYRIGFIPHSIASVSVLALLGLLVLGPTFALIVALTFFPSVIWWSEYKRCNKFWAAIFSGYSVLPTVIFLAMSAFICSVIASSIQHTPYGLSIFLESLSLIIVVNVLAYLVLLRTLKVLHSADDRWTAALFAVLALAIVLCWFEDHFSHVIFDQAGLASSSYSELVVSPSVFTRKTEFSQCVPITSAVSATRNLTVAFSRISLNWDGVSAIKVFGLPYNSGPPYNKDKAFCTMRVVILGKYLKKYIPLDKTEHKLVSAMEENPADK